MVRFGRRQFLKSAGLAVATPALSLVARAQTYPAKPVRFIHGYVPGGSADITCLLMPGELFRMLTGISMIHVPYRGAGPALTDMSGGQVHVMFDNAPSSIEYVRTGKLRALAVTTARRSEVLPDLPTVGDFVPGYE